MKFTKIPTDTFSSIQLNAGVVATGFVPSTGTVSGILGATSGGTSFNATPTFSDYGDDIDNCPKNMLELKKLESWEAVMSGSFVTVTNALAKKLVGAADIDGTDSTLIVPRQDVLTSDFSDIWWIGDYSDKNGDTKGGFVAIHLLNALSTGGFKIQSSDKGKGTFDFEFTGHYSMDAQTTPPFEIYVESGDDEVPPTYTAAELTDGFVYGVTYYTRTGTSPNYIYTEVAAGTEYDSSVTYYTKDTE